MMIPENRTQPSPRASASYSRVCLSERLPARRRCSIATSLACKRMLAEGRADCPNGPAACAHQGDARQAPRQAPPPGGQNPPPRRALTQGLPLALRLRLGRKPRRSPRFPAPPANPGRPTTRANAGRTPANLLLFNPDPPAPPRFSRYDAGGASTATSAAIRTSIIVRSSRLDASMESAVIRASRSRIGSRPFGPSGPPFGWGPDAISHCHKPNAPKPSWFEIPFGRGGQRAIPAFLKAIAMQDRISRTVAVRDRRPDACPDCWSTPRPRSHWPQRASPPLTPHPLITE